MPRSQLLTVDKIDLVQRQGHLPQTLFKAVLAGLRLVLEDVAGS